MPWPSWAFAKERRLSQCSTTTPTPSSAGSAYNKLRAVSVPINTALRGEFLRHQIVDAGCSIMICEGHYLDRVRAIADGVSALKTVLARGRVDGAARQGKVSIAPLDEHRGTDDTPLNKKPLPSDLASLIYTSGTTTPSPWPCARQPGARRARHHHRRRPGRRPGLDRVPVPRPGRRQDHPGRRGHGAAASLRHRLADPVPPPSGRDLQPHPQAGRRGRGRVHRTAS